jgi:hypothetical protein
MLLSRHILCRLCPPALMVEFEAERAALAEHLTWMVTAAARLKVCCLGAGRMPTTWSLLLLLHLAGRNHRP